ncbi:MAG: signal peptidase II [Lachnospiraceae bacterium]|nr:signal peptidase II [Lachnospiraceae bacterium]
MIYMLVIAVIFIAELFIKDYIEAKKNEDTCQYILKKHVIIRRYHNKGALLNLGENRRRVVAVVSIVFSVMMVLIFLITLTNRGNHFMKTGLALLLGGAFSNTYDRMRRKYVVDYFSFNTKFPRITAIVFNIGDFCIAIGAAMTAIAVILNPRI